MESFLLVVIIIVALIRWAIISSRFRDLERKITAPKPEPGDALQSQIATLTQRVWALEKELAHLRSATAASVIAPAVPAPEPIATAPEPMTTSPTQFPREPEPAIPARLAEFPTQPLTAPEPELEPQLTFQLPGEPMSPVVEAPVFAPPQEPLTQRIRRRVAGRDWEAIVGGNWLNKLGVLILVIGIAFGLVYSFTQTGPVGRVAISLAVSLTMLIGGTLTERKEQYRMFARGLIGGGWAALYFTTYAMHAVAAAKLIDNAWIASVLLTAVALGMIVHSLKYRSQSVTGLAYFITFATLTITPVTVFSVLALLPLAASLLYLADRFGWYGMALFGLLATYGTCASRGDAGAPLWSTQALIASYWLLFELFSLLRARRGGEYTTVEKLIYPLNTAGLFALSFPKWFNVDHAHLYQFFALLAAAHLADSILRTWLRPPSSFPEGTPLLDRALSGGYEAGITFAAAFRAVSFLLQSAGAMADFGLLVEGQILVALGLYFRQPYLRALAGAVFVVELGKITLFDVDQTSRIRFTSAQLRSWTPVALLTAVVFYVNRWLEKLKNPYSYAAAGLITIVLGFELNIYYVGVAWIVFALANFEFGIRTKLREFRLQGYIVGMLGSAMVAAQSFEANGWRDAWLPMAIAAVANYYAALRSRVLRDKEALAVPSIASAVSTIFLAALIWKTAPHDYAGIGWLVLGAVLLELGLRNLPASMRVNAYAVGGCGLAWLLVTDVIAIEKTAGLGTRVSLGCAAAVCYLVVARIFRTPAIRETERAQVRNWLSVGGTTFLATVLWVVLADPVVAVGWMIAGVLLLEAGFALGAVSFRVQGDLLSAIAFVRLFLANFTNVGSTLGISHRLLTIAPIALAEYYLWWRHRQNPTAQRERTMSRLYLYAPAVLIVLLMRFELGRVLTVLGWIAFALVLYLVALRKQNPDLRLQTYVIAALAFWRSWTTNFYAPESLAGVPGRVLAGAIVILGFYALQLLAPRDQPGGTLLPGRIFAYADRHARTLFSLLGSALLTILLYYEVSGGLLTVAWGTEAVVLLVAGFPLRDRVLRMSGLFLFLVCIVKLFAYDLRNLATVNRIFSFVILGAVMVAVSWVYTRFRDRIQKLL